ncbi:MAG: ribonuclease HI [Tannerella sp.]|jgi:ribonuclease HI|nr:ribonuclease HI [Tannerella sp.]
MTEIKIYTDGASRGNPGPGGYGTILMSGKYRKELFEGYALTTNNRMELLAVIAGLEALKKEPCNVTVFSDSKYVVDAVEKKWVQSWYKNNFKKKKNKDLWIRYLKVAQKHYVKFVWVKGHAGNIYNEHCDHLAVKAAESSGLKEDTWYIQNRASEENMIF